MRAKSELSSAKSGSNAPLLSWPVEATRVKLTASRVVSFDAYEVDLDRLELRRAGKPITAPLVVLRMLRLFLENPGQLITKEDLIAHAWQQRVVADNAVDVAISRLRKLLGQAPARPEFLTTVYGRGYRFVYPVTGKETGRERAVETPPSTGAGVVVRRMVPLVGRDNALRQLRDALHMARAGQGGMCVLTGEPGIGKTRVLEALRGEAAATGTPVIWTHCHAVADAPPLLPLAQLLHGLLAGTSQHPSERQPPLGELRRLLTHLDAFGEQPSLPAAASGRTSGHLLLQSLSMTLGAGSAFPACVLVIDDLQRADAAFLELLSYWIDEIAGTRFLLVSAIREPHAMPERALRAMKHVVGHRNTTRIGIGRLSESDVAQYLQALLGSERADVARSIFNKSEGHPFYMNELARQLGESSQPSLSSLEVPDAALDLLRQQLSTLDDGTQHVLSWAAVIGRDFDLSMLRAAMNTDVGRVMRCLDDACAKEVITARAHTVTQFTFCHELLRAGLYDALGPAERRQRHLVVALELEQRWLSGEPIAPAALAHHFRCAVPAGDLRKTMNYCIRAAAAAIRADATVDGEPFIQHAREAQALIDIRCHRSQVDAMLSRALNGDGECAGLESDAGAEL
jgi:DNA-binding winged helix-turn-helix (wHTH) protein